MENKLNKVVMSVIVDTNLGLASNRTAYITIVAALGIADETINTFRSISSIGKNNVIPYATTGEIIMRRNTPTPIFSQSNCFHSIMASCIPRISITTGIAASATKSMDANSWAGKGIEKKHLN